MGALAVLAQKRAGMVLETQEVNELPTELLSNNVRVVQVPEE